MRAAAILAAVAAFVGCSTAASGTNSLGCMPGCDGGDLCCPWSADVCHPDSGCGAKSGYICIGADPGGLCPDLQFDGVGDGG